MIDIRTETTYTTSDGRVFTSERRARAHEAELEIRTVCAELFPEPKAAEVAQVLIAGPYSHRDRLREALRDL